MATISWAYQSGAPSFALYTASSSASPNTLTMRSAASAPSGGGGGGEVTAGLLFHLDAGNASSILVPVLRGLIWLVLV